MAAASFVLQGWASGAARFASSWFRASRWRQHPRPLTTLFIYRHNTIRGRGDEKQHLVKPLPAQTAPCLQQGPCERRAVGRRARGRPHGAGQAARQGRASPLPSEPSISTGRPPWSSHGQPSTWKGRRKRCAKGHE